MIAVYIVLGIAAVWLLWWYVEVYSARKHWREATEEMEAMKRRYPRKSSGF